MRLGLANKFFLISILLYFIAGAMALLEMEYSILALLAAVIFLAFGFVKNRQSETGGMLAVLHHSKRFLSMLGNFSHMLVNWLPATSQRLVENFRHFINTRTKRKKLFKRST